MNFEEYQLHGRAKYAAFVDAIRAILAALVDAHDLVPHGITGRAKDPVSLKKKLADRKIDPASAVDEVLKDLSGTGVLVVSLAAAGSSTNFRFNLKCAQSCMRLHPSCDGLTRHPRQARAGRSMLWTDQTDDVRDEL
jgi:hypothetical protein